MLNQPSSNDAAILRPEAPSADAVEREQGEEQDAQREAERLRLAGPM